MPTTLPRFQVTETPEIERALAIAARRWPDLPRSELVKRLFGAGADSIEAEEQGLGASRMALLDRLRGAFADAYEPGYLTALREDWPE